MSHEIPSAATALLIFSARRKFLTIGPIIVLAHTPLPQILFAGEAGVFKPISNGPFQTLPNLPTLVPSVFPFPEFPLFFTMADAGTSKPSALKSFLSGGFGGICLVFAGHPLDLIKVRMQTMTIGADGVAPYSSTLDCARKTIQRDGVGAGCIVIQEKGGWVGLERQYCFLPAVSSV
jgi:hypothetical protein